MSDSNDLTTAFDNMKLFTQDHLITSLRPDLREGVLEASQILEKEILRLKTENANLENKLELKHAENLNLERSPETGVKDVENLNPERSSEPGVKHVENLNLERSPETRVKDAENLNLERSPEPGSDTKSQSIQSFPSKADTSEVISENYELITPTGPIDIGRPYPVYMICYICNQRVLTKTQEKSSGGCCLSCLVETTYLTVLHSCPICHTFLGIYNDKTEDSF
ncbi:uncharacterized protein [Halyomorpha halys]|uniref:uncharacterized protein isoform X3 n=1 Tax=Halyomorpha halys TaxID=286706 RepID=UPI0006D4F0E9|nr:uncharacterized protein LOC106682982 isoform X3 [Halyomorpha halys]